LVKFLLNNTLLKLALRYLTVPSTPHTRVVTRR